MKILYLPNCYSQQRQFQKKVFIYPILMAMEATKRKFEGHDVYWALKDTVGSGYATYDKIITEPEGLPFLLLPKPDRIFTRAMDYAFDNGNFKYPPGTYIMSSNTCWFRGCSFCVERKINKYELRDVNSVLDEIGECLKLGYKEIFDDSGTFPLGLWLAQFAEGMILRGYNKKIRIGCNMRLDYHHPNLEGMRDMRRAGFRMLLYGLESANQATLDKLNKGINIDSAIQYIKWSAKAGLEPHISFMISYPWETYEDTMRTINLVKSLLLKGYAKTAQCSFYTPPKEQKQGNEGFRKYVNKFYEVGYNPLFWWNKLISLRSINDLEYLWKSIKAGLFR